MNFLPNAGDYLAEILKHPKYYCNCCQKPFCGGTCGVGESLDNFMCVLCANLP